MRTTVTNRKMWLAAIVVATVALDSGGVHAARTHNRLAGNRLAGNHLEINKLASQQLAAYALTSTKLQANTATADLLSTADGREVYSYLISCALPQGTTIQAQVPTAPDTDDVYTCVNGVCTFSGALGLAEYWTDHRLPPQGQRWVSACMFARVNLFDIAESISLRGPHDNLTVSGDEAQQYSLQEGAFFGNLFTDGPIDWNACRGEGQATSESGGLNLRDCTEPDPAHPGLTKCGFKYAGDCGLYSSLGNPTYACRTYDADQGTFTDCHTEATDGKWPGLQGNREVITTYVHN